MSRFTTHAALALRVIREIALTLLALGGAACIVLTVMAFAGGYSLIMFKTGSMAPTIPAGSVALVHQVAASELSVGDVVTIDRENALPVTHRITAIDAGAADDERIITMRGDANDADDPFPYVVTEARSVIGSVPHLAHVIVWFGNPWVLGSITLGAAALVTWAFWPRATRGSVPVPSSSPDDPPQTRRGRRAAGLAAAGTVFVVAALPLAPAPAQAADDILVIVSHLDAHEEHALDAEDPLYWYLDVNAVAAPADGELTIDISADDNSTLPLRSEIRTCEVAWSAEGCGAGERMVGVAGALPLDGEWQRLVRAQTPRSVHLQVALTAPVPASDPTASASVTVRAIAGQTVASETINGDDGLAMTGGQSWGILAAPAAIVVGVGIAFIVAAKRRRSGR